VGQRGVTEYGGAILRKEACFVGPATIELDGGGGEYNYGSASAWSCLVSSLPPLVDYQALKHTKGFWFRGVHVVG
jgi:hypothetical protein